MERAYATLARMLLDCPAWRNSYVAMGGLGWRMPGIRSLVLDVALRRARLWHLPPHDAYRKIFCLNQGDSCSECWSSKSRTLLHTYHVPDIVDLGCPLLTVGAYKTIVKNVLEGSFLHHWRAGVAPHSIPFPFRELYLAPLHGCDTLVKHSQAWSTLAGHR